MEVDRKRSSSNGDTPDAKKHAGMSVKKLVTAEDIEEFQKEAILRQMNAYRRERDELLVQLNAIQTGGDDALREEIARITEKYVEAERQIERLRSSTVARVSLAVPEKQESESTPTEAAATPQVDSESTSISAQELIEAKTKTAAVEAELAKTAEFLKQEEQSRHRIEADLRKLEVDLATVPATNQGFQTRLKEFAADNTRLAAEAQKLQQQISDIKAGEAEYEQNVREKYMNTQLSLERRLAAAEADVTRIRGLRDDLISEINVLKAEGAERQIEIKALKEAAALDERPETRNGSDGPASAAAESESADLPSDAEQLKERCITLIRQNKALSSEISGLEQGFARAKAKAKSSLKDVAAAEQKLGVLNTAKSRSDEKYFGAMRARDAAGQEVARMKLALTKSSDVVAELKVTEQRLTAQLARFQKQEGQVGLDLQKKQREYEALQRSKQEVESQLLAMRQANDKLKELLSVSDAEKANLETSKRRAETSVEKYKRQLETQQAISGLGTPSEVQEQLESLRSIAMCPVCQKNWKDRALVTCGHTMCADCVKTRLASRMRKCPMCNGHFASNDVLAIHL